MAIELDKMLADLSGSGEDIKVLALGTLLQCDFGPLAHEKDKLMALKDYLENNPNAFPGDMGFLYRQVVEKFRDSPLLLSLGDMDTTINTDSMVTAVPVNAGVRIPASPSPPPPVFPEFSTSAEEQVGFGTVSAGDSPDDEDPFAALNELPVAPVRVFTHPDPAPTPIEAQLQQGSPQKTPLSNPLGQLFDGSSDMQVQPDTPAQLSTQPQPNQSFSVSPSADSFTNLLSLPSPQQVKTLLAIKAKKHRESYPTVRELLSSSRDDRVVATCISVLGEIGSKDDVPSLRPYLGHADSRIRANCIDAVGKIGSPLQILLFVAPMTRDFNKRARNNANRCLARLGRVAIVKLLSALLTQNDVNLRKNALYAIDNFQGPDVMKLLARALSDKSEYIRMEVLNVLGRRKEPAVKELILKATNDPNPSVKHLAATLLKGFDQRNPSAGHRVALQGMVDSLDPDEPLPDLSLLKDNDLSVQIATLKKVAEQYTDEAYEYVCQILDDSDEPELIIHSIKALTAIGGRADFERLRRFLDSKNDAITLSAVDSISQLGAPQDLLTYLTPLLRSESVTVRDGVMRQLMRFKPQILLSHFNKLLHAKNNAVKIIGIYALSCFSGDTVQKLLTSVAAVKHPEIQFNLARALRNRSQQWSVDILKEFTKDPNNRISLAARSSLAHIRGEKPSELPAPAPVPSVKTGSDETGKNAPLSAVHDIASAVQDISGLEEARATEAVSEDDMLSKSFVGNLADLVSTSPTMSTLFGKLSDKKSSAMKELSELDKKQRVIYEKMGRVVYDLCNKGEINEPEFNKTVFVIKKHLNLKKEKQSQSNDASGGFLASLLGGEGAGTSSNSDVALKQQYVFLGKTAYRLNQQNGLSISQLSECILDIQALEERISQLMKEG